VEIVAQVDRDEVVRGATGARGWVAGVGGLEDRSSSVNAHTIATVARPAGGRFPRCAHGMRMADCRWISSGVIAARAGEGSNEHYAELARWQRSPAAHRGQAGTATRSRSSTRTAPSINKTSDEEFTQLAITPSRPWTRRSSTRHLAFIVMR